jgi:methionine synthase I (cobalamin-dependent)
MSDDSHPNSAINAATSTNVHHTQLSDLPSNVSLSMLTNALRLVRGEISAQEAVTETLKDTVVGGTVGGTTAFATTTVAAACPPIAIALTTVAPALAVVGATGMVYEFFKILDNHKQAVRAYYESLTRQELDRLQEIENELIYEHNKNLDFLSENKKINQEIKNRPISPGIEGAMKRYLESAAIAQSLGLTSADSKLIPDVDLSYLLPEQ